MATNFEYYLSNAKKQFEKNNFASSSICAWINVTDYVHDCRVTNCGDCILKFIEYLAQEHIEQPKLTKRERAFCEAVQTGRIARDRDGSLCWYPDDAVVQKSGVMWNAEKYMCISHIKLQFLCIKWEDEKPWSVADLLKLDVMDEVQEDA